MKKWKGLGFFLKYDDNFYGNAVDNDVDYQQYLYELSGGMMGYNNYG